MNWHNLVIVTGVLLLAYPVYSQTPNLELDAAIKETLDVSKYTVQDLAVVAGDDDVVFPVMLDGVQYTLTLHPHSIRSGGFKILVHDETGLTELAELPKSQTYRGSVNGVPESYVTGSITDNGIEALVHLPGGDSPTWVIHPVLDLAPGSPHAHVVYNARDNALDEWHCGVTNDFPQLEIEHHLHQRDAPDSSSEFLCEISCDADFEYYHLNGSSVAATVQDIEGVLNSASVIFERDCQVRFSIATVIVRTSEPDPYTASNPHELLEQFRDDWNSSQLRVHRDIAHLFTGKNLGLTIGTAYFDVVCDQGLAYGYSQSLFTGNYAARVALTAHEIGHNFAALHCNESPSHCSPCNIMCSVIAGCTGNLTEMGCSAAPIVGRANALSCLGPPEYYVNGSCGNDSWDGRSRFCTGPAGPFRTIQAAIDAAEADSLVNVLAGTFVENIDFRGKNIVVRSVAGPHVTTIDGAGSGSVVSFRSGETSSSVLSGFTITNGFALTLGQGGGITCMAASPTIHNCIITNNYGSGLLALRTSASQPFSSPIIENCTITQNVSDGFGGGVAFFAGSPKMVDCVVRANIAANAAGIFATQDSTPSVVRCLIADNITNGPSGSWGGGFGATDSSPSIVNCVLANNLSDWGGGVFVSDSTGFSLVNSVVAANHATVNGGGLLLLRTFRSTSVDNTVVTANKAIEGTQVYLADGGDVAYLRMSYSNVDGGQSAIHVDPGANLTWGPGNIDEDPRFVDATAGDFRVLPGSPCIDAGNNAALPAGIVLDLNGAPRYRDDLGVVDTGVPGNGFTDVVDIGAYEFQDTSCYADCTPATGVGVLDIFDFLCFQDAFVNGTPRACDCDTSTGQGVCDIFDFLCFQDAFVAGCP